MNTLRMAAVSLLVCLFWLEVVRLAGAEAPADQSAVSQSGSDSKYVIFTLGGLEDIHDPAQETPFQQRLSKLVEELKEAFHRTPNDTSRFVGFTPGLTRVQNLPARELEARVVAALDVAEETDMPVFFHLDDMHFCYDRADLFGDGESAEWSAFPKPGETHGPIVERYWLNWGQWVVFPAPVPCFESPKFREDVTNRMRKRVAQPLVARLEDWRLQGREYLFAGIAVGNETQVPDYRGVLKGSRDGRIEGMDVTQRPPRKVQMEPREMTRAGYHALQLRGYTQASIESLAKEQGRDVQEVITTLLDDVAADYSAFRCRILREAGVPREEIFTHTTSPFRAAAIRAREQYPEMFGTAGSSNFPPPVRCAINNDSRPGFTVARDSLDLPSLTTEIKRVRGAANPDRRWAAVESYATTGQPGRPQTRQEYEQYLGSLLAHGAVLVNVYGWNVPPQNPFAIVRDGGVVQAIQGWLRGDELPTSWVNVPSEPLQPVQIIHAKMGRLQQAMRQRQENGGDLTAFAGVMQEFRPLMEAGKIAEAEAVLDRALALLEGKAPTVAADPPSSDAAAPPRATDALITPPRPVQLGKIPAAAEIVYHQNGHIYVMDSKGEGVTQITFGERRPWEHAAVSYDRRYVVGNANTPHPKGGHRSELWLFDLEKGTEARLLPGFHSAGGGGVDWDPNGFIYFAAIEKRPAPSRDFPRDMALADDIYRIRFDGTGLKRLTHDTEVAEADVAVAEDGRLVVYAAAAGMGTPEQRVEIWMMNADGTNQRRVHRGGPIGAEDEGAHDPELSPDNHQVVFSKVNHKVPPNWPHIPGLNTAHDLYVANLDGTGLRRLTRPGSISIIPDWQGERIVFDERSEKDNYQGASIVSAGGTDQTPRRIKPGIRMPKWIPRLKASAQSRAAAAPVSSDAARKLEGLIVCAEAGPGRSQGPNGLFSIQANGSGKKRLTESVGQDVFPAWSHDGRKIVFASNRTGKFELWVMDADGSGLKQLTHAPEDAVGRARWVNAVPSWSPDGRRIAFASARSGTMEIWSMDADGGSPRQLTHSPPGKSSNAPNWSPDGRKIAFASDRSGTVQIYTMDPDGGNVVQLTQSVAPDFPDANVPVWSPDNRQIAFWSGVEHRTGQVWVMNADGSERRQLTKARGNSDNPAWSPDGRHIIFETGRSGIGVETWIMNADGSNERRLFDFPYGAGRLPWQPVTAALLIQSAAFADENSGGAPGRDGDPDTRT